MIMTDPIAAQCQKLLPRIVRARFFYLYDDKGRRYIDLAGGNGRSLLGARPEGLAAELKNVLARGLIQDYPSVYAFRLKKQLARLLPEHRQVRIFSGPQQALDFLDTSYPGESLADPVFREIPENGLALWRPFCPAGWEKARILFPVLPFPGSFAPAVLCFKNRNPEVGREDEPASAWLLAGLLRAAVLLERKLKENPRWWAPFEEQPWPSKGPYLRYPGRPEDYPESFRRALEAGIILPAGPGEPLIIPEGLSSGEIRKILQFLAGRTG